MGMPKVFYHLLAVLLFTFLWVPEVSGQPTLPSDLKKPEKYQNKLLGAEKSGLKKFKGPRKFIQNTVTHYNWHFNANNKLEQVIEAAKLAHKDDFTQLLPFYNYSLEHTAANKTELDSVIYKSNTGILSHDLRNAWIDNLFMLIGKAYYLRKDLDSAYLTFQYINYAFSPKEADGYDMPIGSNANEGTNALSVSTKEKNSIVRRAFSTPPSRNESFIWQIKTYIAKESMAEAASLIQTLKNDAAFPERLNNDLSEVQALWFYRQKMYDSAAVYLEAALPNANDRIETSRWEFLIGQLYDKAQKPTKATEFFERARKRTLDPVLEVHAILNMIRQSSNDSVEIQNKIDELKKMGRRDRYQAYRDIIFYTAAQIELERNNIAGAKEMLLKSIKYTTLENPSQRTASFLLLGNICFKEKKYPEAKNYYDSINNSDPGIPDLIAFDIRKNLTATIVSQINIIARQDSLQLLAAMPENERTAFLRKKVRQLRRQQGLKEEEEFSVNAAVGMSNNNKAAPDLFDNSKGDWYFNNASVKSKGFTSFKQTWGNRPNTDNWRRAAAVAQTLSASKTPQPGGKLLDDTGLQEDNELTVAGLLKGIPLNAEQMQISEDSIAGALLEIGIINVDKLEEYYDAIDSLERYIDKYTYHERRQDGLYYLYLAYQLTGQQAKANAAKQELDQKYAGTPHQAKIDDMLTGTSAKLEKEVTDDYNKIYIQFIEGEFTEAQRRKKINDSIYGTTYWTPQLLYIEAVYHLQTRNDDEARKVLGNIIKVFPSNPMAEKAKNILDILGRRKEIEDYLTNLEIKREEDTLYVAKIPPKRVKEIEEEVVVEETEEEVESPAPEEEVAAVDAATETEKTVEPSIDEDTAVVAKLPPAEEPAIPEDTVAIVKLPPMEELADTAAIAKLQVLEEPVPTADTTTIVKAPEQEKPILAADTAAIVKTPAIELPVITTDSLAKVPSAEEITKVVEDKKLPPTIPDDSAMVTKAPVIKEPIRLPKDTVAIVKTPPVEKKTEASPIEDSSKLITAKPAVKKADSIVQKKPVIQEPVAKKPAPKTDSLVKEKLVIQEPVAKKPPVKVDSIAKEKETAQEPVAKKLPSRAEDESVYTLRTETPHAVAVLLNKVDPVYVTESRNAFNKYNQEQFSGKRISINNISLDENVKLVLMTGFENARAALDYIEATKSIAISRIVPWLPADKFDMMIISERNVEVLKKNQDLNSYRKFEEIYFK